MAHEEAKKICTDSKTTVCLLSDFNQ